MLRVWGGGQFEH